MRSFGMSFKSSDSTLIFFFNYTSCYKAKLFSKKACLVKWYLENSNNQLPFISLIFGFSWFIFSSFRWPCRPDICVLWSDWSVPILFFMVYFLLFQVNLQTWYLCSLIRLVRFYTVFHGVFSPVSGDLADLIFVFFDPIGQALCKRTLNLVEKLNEKHAERMRFYLSKADEAGHESDRQVSYQKEAMANYQKEVP